jgi:cytochrome c553
MKGCWRCWIALIAIVLVSAALIIVSGIAPATASSGHFPITAWVLEFAMERTVTTHSVGITVPPLDNAALIKRGASHYDVGCYWCHGAPGGLQPRTALHMTPHPPDLAEEVLKWDPQELFYIVRHGVKFTGMPGWPSEHRDDEVWAVVAFLQRYPQMDANQYAELSGRIETAHAKQLAYEASQSNANSVNRNGSDTPVVVIERCVACHGSDGAGRSANPKLAGQSASYLRATLEAYRSGARHSGIMGPIAAALSNENIAQSADYFHALSADTASANVSDAALLAEGRVIAERGLPKQRAGACIECHGTTSHEPEERYPFLAGQRRDYLVQQLHLFRSDDRGGTDRAHVMLEMAEMLTDRQIAAVAAYYSSMKPAPLSK